MKIFSFYYLPLLAASLSSLLQNRNGSSVEILVFTIDKNGVCKKLPSPHDPNSPLDNFHSYQGNRLILKQDVIKMYASREFFVLDGDIKNSLYEALLISQNNRKLHQARVENLESVIGQFIYTNIKQEFMMQLYKYIGLEFCWWEIQKDIIALLEAKENTIDVEKRLIDGLLKIIRFQKLKAFRTAELIIENFTKKTELKMKKYSEKNPLFYSYLIGLVETSMSHSLLSCSHPLYSSLFYSEILATGKIIVLFSNIFKFSTSVEGESHYHKKALDLQRLSETRLKALSDIEKLELGLIKGLILKTTKETWYSREVEDNIDVHILHANELELDLDLDLDLHNNCHQTEGKVKETRNLTLQVGQTESREPIEPSKRNKRDKRKRNGQGEKECPVDDDKNVPKKNDNASSATGEDSSNYTTDYYDSIAEEKKRRLNLKKEHEENIEKEKQRAEKTSKIETSHQKTLREVIETRESKEEKIQMGRELNRFLAADEETNSFYMQNKSSSVCRTKLTKAQKYAWLKDPTTIINGKHLKTLCILFSVIPGQVKDGHFLELAMRLGVSESPKSGPSGSNRTFSTSTQIMSIHRPHKSDQFDWPRCLKFCKKAQFDPHFFTLIE